MRCTLSQPELLPDQLFPLLAQQCTLWVIDGIATNPLSECLGFAVAAAYVDGNAVGGRACDLQSYWWLQQ